MTLRITTDVLKASLDCRYKGHLRQAGETGSPSDYEIMSAEQHADSRRQAIDRIVARHAGEVVRDAPLAVPTLKSGPAFLLDALLEEDTLSVRFDGLQRVVGPSKLGDYHYVPVLFHGGGSVRKEQRFLLDVCGLLLSRIQGRMPGHGVVWHGRECRATKVRLSPDPRKAERLLRDLQPSREAGPLRLVLNDHCQVCEFRQRCRDQGVREDNLSLLRGLGEKEVNGYARKGILTLTQLAHMFRPRRKGKRANPRNHHRYHALHALSIRDKRVYLFGTPEVADAPVKIFLDIEGLPDEGFVYLIGMTVVEGGSERHLAFWADTRNEESEVFEHFLDEVGKYPNCRVYCYGSYERAFLKRMRKSAARKGPVDRVLAALVNVLSVVYAHAYFPCYSNGLKDVAGCLGFSWSEPTASGVQSIVWRKRWEAGNADQWKQTLLTYNREDCGALRRVTEFLWENHPGTGAPGGTKPAREGCPPVSPVEELDRLGTIVHRGKIKFFHDDFKYVNGCAHFDYQRKRVYVRTGKARKKTVRKRRQLVNRAVRVNKRVQILGRKCPSCKSGGVTRWATGKQIPGQFLKYKTSFDLVFTPSGIKRKVIECRTAVHECGACGKIFVPDRYRRLAKHFHGLKSWAVYEHVKHQRSCPVLAETLREFFGISVSAQEINAFKGMMARYYKPCSKKLRDKILAAPVLYVDETEVRLRTGKGYVWVFATAEEVMYLYQATREGEFLTALLKDFSGVLVSDFYAAYDNLPCPQQKCLIHLIRDMNQELLNNPFDTELQSITSPFGTLLRATVEEIDRHGLKKRHLEKHQKAADGFFDNLAAQSFRSESAESLRARLLKYREKLFTFLGHDGVSWNNNNAENAIRQFAYYRDVTRGRLREDGLREYLSLLGISHTCRYKGVSFLKFLLSRERDMDAFCKSPTRKCPAPVIEVYPKGVERPDFRPSRMRAGRQESPSEPTG